MTTEQATAVVRTLVVVAFFGVVARGFWFSRDAKELRALRRYLREALAMDIERRHVLEHLRIVRAEQRKEWRN